MIISIRQWKKEDVRDIFTFYLATIYSTTVKVENVPFLAEYTLEFTMAGFLRYGKICHYWQDIRIYQGDRLVTVIPNKSTDTNVANKLIADAFQKNPVLRYLVERSGKA